MKVKMRIGSVITLMQGNYCEDDVILKVNGKKVSSTKNQESRIHGFADYIRPAGAIYFYIIVFF